MERECCLTMLITLIGGSTLLACGWWPIANVQAGDARCLEKIRWRYVWLPVVPTLVVAALLCGWALVEPDPVPEKVPAALLWMTAPFALLAVRAMVRAVWSLIADAGDPGIWTVGLLRPWIVFSPHLARKLGDRQIEAALEHERAHARHRDPMRIWLAQLATDLQWPWPQARERLARWLIALELARDEEARVSGIDGADLADAILASAHFIQHERLPLQAALIGDPSALKERMARLLVAVPVVADRERREARGQLVALLMTLMLAVALGSIFGEHTVRALFRITA